MNKCDDCNKKAVVNYQTTWVKYNIDKKGNYDEGEILYYDGNENKHFCKKCGEEWENSIDE